jgi:CheY-like chemotaxis protein
MAILLVEDDIDVAEAIAKALEDAGHVVDVVPDGAAALGYLAGRPAPAVILLDLMMPVMDGEEFRRRQQVAPFGSEIPVVVISARRDAVAVAVSIGAEDCLEKPMTLDDLLHAVEVFEPPASP